MLLLAAFKKIELKVQLRHFGKDQPIVRLHVPLFHGGHGTITLHDDGRSNGLGLQVLAQMRHRRRLRRVVGRFGGRSLVSLHALRQPEPDQVLIIDHTFSLRELYRMQAAMLLLGQHHYDTAWPAELPRRTRRILRRAQRHYGFRPKQ